MPPQRWPILIPGTVSILPYMAKRGYVVVIQVKDIKMGCYLR